MIRPARPADLDEICLLIHELADYEELAHEVVLDVTEVERWLFGDDPAAAVLIAETDDGAVAGMALWYRTFSTFLGRPGIWLEDLFVRPQHRGQGFGLALIEALRELTDGRVEWAVLDWNEPSIRFYESLGARPVVGWTRYRWSVTSDQDLRVVEPSQVLPREGSASGERLSSEGEAGARPSGQ